MAKKQFEVYELPEDLTMPLLAAVRLLERSINPAFSFVLRCLNCSQYRVKPVASASGDGSVIGLQCHNPDCLRTIKFLRPLRWDADDLPERLRQQPASALKAPKDKKAKVTPAPEWIEDAFNLVQPDE
jgi:hypothetical protein